MIGGKRKFTELLTPAASDRGTRRRLTKAKDAAKIIINRQGRSTYPDEKSVSRSEATPGVVLFRKHRPVENTSVRLNLSTGVHGKDSTVPASLLERSPCADGDRSLFHKLQVPNYQSGQSIQRPAGPGDWLLTCSGKIAIANACLATKVWELFCATDNCSVPVLAAFMSGVVACLAKNNAIFKRVRSPELCVTNMVSMGDLAKFMLGTSFLAERRNSRSARPTTKRLPNQGELLRWNREFLPCHFCVSLRGAKSVSGVVPLRTP